MPKAAYCDECKRYVWVTSTGCENGHPMPCLRNVHEAQSLGAPSSTQASEPNGPAEANGVAGLFSRVNPRVRGAVLLVFGIILAKWQIYDPLHALQLGLQSVVTSSVLLGFAVLFPVMGLLYVVFGERADSFFRNLRIDPKHLDVKSVAIILVVAAPVIGLYIWVSAQLSAQGYH
jgi:hypothetical protein